MKFNAWFGYITVHPRRMVEREEDGVTRKVWQAARSDEAMDGAARLLAHCSGRNLIHTPTLSAGEPVKIQCAVPRLSDDHDADCKRAEAFVTAVFYGEPTEGL